MDEWTEIKASSENTEIPMWDKTGKLIGTYLAKRVVGPKQSVIYDIMVEDGTVVGAWGSMVLNEKMDEAQIGNMVSIEHTGDKVSKNGNKYAIFTVLTKKANPITINPITTPKTYQYSQQTTPAQEIDPTEAVNAVFGTSAIPDMPLGA